MFEYWQRPLWRNYYNNLTFIVIKIFVTIGNGSHTNTTTQVKTKRRTLVLLDSQPNNLIKINRPGLLDNNFSITFLEIRFPNIGPGLSWRKTALSKISNARHFNSFFSNVQERSFGLWLELFRIFTARVIFGLNDIQPVTRLQDFLKWLINIRWLFCLSHFRNTIKILVLLGVFLAHIIYEYLILVVSRGKTGVWEND